MKFFSNLATVTATLLFAAGTTYAQNAQIGYPPHTPGAVTPVTRGQNLTVEVDRPNTITGSLELGVAIGLQTCQYGCHYPAEGLGELLFNGSYDPQYYEYYKPPYQNFTVQIPPDTPEGPALLGILHVSLYGASNTPLLETFAVNLTVV